ncbi:Hypothetical predicted protein [Scomber scombrus]|uniref:Uncharacterized protein n=1 Tax=Scomber scombrus TaxID=13677 RepID=A0AAV1MYQ7_SCOSC
MRTAVSVADQTSTLHGTVRLCCERVVCVHDIFCVGSGAQDVFNRHTNNKNKPPENKQTYGKRNVLIKNVHKQFSISEKVSTNKHWAVESVPLGFSRFHGIKKRIGATATQTLVVVTTHINHSFLFIRTQKLQTIAVKVQINGRGTICQRKANTLDRREHERQSND